jgi:hypothetical protein
MNRFIAAFLTVAAVSVAAPVFAQDAELRTSVVPYLTGGVGGMTMFEREALTVNDAATFLTGNVGGGVAWYAGRWGVRGDYRFVAVQSKDDASAFFGAEERYGHRVYAGVLVNIGR